VRFGEDIACADVEQEACEGAEVQQQPGSALASPTVGCEWAPYSLSCAWWITIDFSTRWKNRKPATSAIIGVLKLVPVVRDRRAISGRTSKATTPRMTPAVKPSTRCSRSLLRSANRPPSNVDTNVLSMRNKIT